MNADRALVHKPASVGEAAEALRAADRVRIGDDLSTERLDRILEHEAGDLTCIVEAGVRLSQLDAALAPHGQMLALDPPGDPTIGACVAASLSGPRSHRYGTIRDLVIGITVVLADGTIASSGGKVVKNVAGYDLAKLFCGSQGRLGLVARVALRLHPRPRATRTLVAEPDAWPTLRASQLEPACVDLVGGRLAIRFEHAVDAQLDAARALLGGDEDDGAVWEDSARRQAAAKGRAVLTRDNLSQALVARVRTRVAYVDHEVPRAWSPLAERVRAALDPEGKLS
jgi:glycolate oxidase FAD binding subunit